MTVLAGTTFCGNEDDRNRPKKGGHSLALRSWLKEAARLEHESLPPVAAWS